MDHRERERFELIDLFMETPKISGEVFEKDTTEQLTHMQSQAYTHTHAHTHTHTQTDSKQDSVELLGTKAFLCHPFLDYRK